MNTHEEVLQVAKQIQSNSSSNVSVGVSLTLGGFGTTWSISVMTVTPSCGLINYILLSPYSDQNRIELLAKHGYNSKTAALNS